MNIHILGPGDRFNYGDLLFPLVIQYALGNEFHYQNYGLVKSDLAAKGAMPTHSMGELRRVLKKSSPRNNAVMVAGGESMAASLSVLYGFINPLYARLRKNGYFKKADQSLAIAQKLTGVRNQFPFVPEETNFPVFYNAVGANGLQYLPKTDQALIIERLQQAKYVAVRDQNSYKQLKPHLDTQVLHLVPDCVLVLNKMYPAEKLAGLVSHRLQESLPGQYLAIQLSLPKTKGHEAEIIEQIKLLAKQTGLPIIGIPIGTAPGHEDQIRLREVALHVPQMKVIEAPSIYDIMLVIAKSEAFVGTSLHGAITATAYSRPFVSLQPKQEKITAFLETWYTGPVAVVQPFNQLAKATTAALERGPTGYNLPELQKNILDSFRRMGNLLGKENEQLHPVT